MRRSFGGVGADGTSLRDQPGVATMSTLLPDVTGPWLRGTEGNAGLVPGQVAARLDGRQFNNFGEFRSAFWKEAADTPELASQFRRANVAAMQKGYAPSPAKAQLYGGHDAYVLHHRNPVSNGGGVYDMSNVAVVTPLMHQSILDPGFHFGRNPR